MTRRPGVVLILVFALLSWLFMPERSRGQVVPSEEVSLSTPARPEPTRVLEKSIDPAEYLVGGGDELSIDIWGQINVHHVLTVTPEGNLLVPRVGRIQVGEMCLSDAKEVIRKEILRSFRNAEVTITLLNLRMVKVTVAGAVGTPGSARCPPIPGCRR